MLRVHGVALAAIFVMGANVAWAGSLPAADVMCHRTPGATERATRILIVGESWASKGKMLPNLPIAAAKGLGPVIACSVGFSGRNTSEILGEYGGLKEAGIEGLR